MLLRLRRWIDVAYARTTIADIAYPLVEQGV